MPPNGNLVECTCVKNWRPGKGTLEDCMMLGLEILPILASCLKAKVQGPNQESPRMVVQVLSREGRISSIQK